MIENLNIEIKKAMKDKNKDRLKTLRMILSETKNIAINDRRKEHTDSDLIPAISKGIKQRQDSIEQFTKANRQDLVDVEEFELKIYKEFQQKQMSEEELITIIDKVISDTGATSKKQIGPVMKSLMLLVKGRSDNRLVSKLVNERLS